MPWAEIDKRNFLNYIYYCVDYPFHQELAMDSAKIPVDFFDDCTPESATINLKTETGEEHRGCRYVGHNPESLGVIPLNSRKITLFPFHDLAEIIVHKPS